MSFVFNRPKVYSGALKTARFINSLPDFMVYSSINAWGYGHKMMEFPKESFHSIWKKGIENVK